MSDEYAVILSKAQIKHIIDAIYRNYQCKECQEIVEILSKSFWRLNDE